MYAPSQSSSSLEGYLWCQTVGIRSRPWQRQYFLLGSAELRVSKSEPSTIGGLLSAALARELSEDEMRQSNDDETELVATLTVIFGENVYDRSGVPSRSGQPMVRHYDCKRGATRI